MFTDKAKEKFDEWLDTYYEKFAEWDCSGWDNLTASMQWGVIQDFGDSLGYLLEIEPFFDDFTVWIWQKNTEEATTDRMYTKGSIEHRQQARTEAIKKLNELINS